MPIDDNEPGAGQVNDGPAPPPGLTNTGTGAGIYVKIAVPNFNGAGPTGRQMQSYLRLGAIEPEVPPGKPYPSQNGIDITGEDLASLVQGFTDDLRIRTPTDIAELTAALTAAQMAGSQTQVMYLQAALAAASPAEIAGLASATNPPAPQTLPLGTNALATDQPASPGNAFPGTVNNRLAESAVLHTKGGWRDHSDGNRITTTRGDKVEIIRGNYKMVILGRQDLNPLVPSSDFDLEDWATGLDESGGLSDNQDQARGLNGVLAVSYNWEQDSDGRWGWTQKTQTGSYNTTSQKSSEGNGKQIAYTWVDEIQSFTGGPDPNAPGYPSPPAAPPPPAPAWEQPPGGVDAEGNKRVNRIYNRTWVNVLDELTDAATSIAEVVQTDGSYTSTTAAGTTLSTLTQAGQDMTTVTTAVGTMNVTTATLGTTGYSTVYSVDPSTGAVTNTANALGAIGNAAFNNTVQSAGDVNNVTQADGKMTNVTEAGSFIFEKTWAPMHVNIELSLLLLELKLFKHMDVHGVSHDDIHLLMHNDLHIGPHLTLDVAGEIKLYNAPDIDIGLNSTFIKGLLLVL